MARWRRAVRLSRMRASVALASVASAASQSAEDVWWRIKRACCPGRRRRLAPRTLGDLVRRLALAFALGLDVEAAEAGDARRGILDHVLEDFPRRIAVALELRRLRLQEPRQRLVRRAPQRLMHGALRGAHVAGGDCDQPLRDGLAAALAIAPPPAAARCARAPRRSPRTNQSSPIATSTTTIAPMTALVRLTA